MPGVAVRSRAMAGAMEGMALRVTCFGSRCQDGRGVLLQRGQEPMRARVARVNQ
jgi:hypothetical protein